MALHDLLSFNWALIGLICSGFAYGLGAIIYNIFFHPLRNYPGPKSWAATRLPYTLSAIRGQMHASILDLHMKYGPIVRVSPNELAYNDSNAWKELHGHVKGQTGDHGRDPVATYDHRDGIMGAKPEDHARFRRALSHGFSAQTMMEQEPIMKKYVDLLLQRLHENCTNGPLDMVKWYNFVTFDMIGDLTFGESFDCLEGSEYHTWIKIIFNNIKASAIGIQARRFPIIDRILQSFVPKHLLEQMEQHNALTRSRVLKRLEHKGERPDFMESLLHKRGDDREFTLPQLEVTSSALILAGSETTATALSGITYFLLTHPDVLKKLTDEVRTSFPSEDEINMINVQSLPYMNAVVNEGLRMYPPVPTGIPRRVGPDGGVFFGQFIPENTIVQIWHWAVFHSPQNFALPDSFIPERWLDEDARFANDKEDAFQPFSVGPRGCIGRNLANAEMRLILARIIWNFDIKLDVSSKRWLAEMESYILWQKQPLNVLLKPRAILETK